MIARIMSALALVLGIALLVGSLWHQHQVRKLRGQVDRAEHAAAQWQASATQQAAARAAEAQIHAKQQEALNAATHDLDAARADADAAHSALDRLRQRAAVHAAAARQAGPDPAPASPGQAASAPADLLADVLSRAADRARQLADYADRARIAGEACERSYEAVRPAQ